MATKTASATPTLWTPARVLVTRSAAELPHGAEIIARCEAAGVAHVDVLSGDRLPSLRADHDRAAYALAKRTLAVVVAPPSKRRLQPIPPSADWRVDLAEGCPGHCQYCYLAGSLSGPPITRVYANLPEILSAMDEKVGHGTVTSASTERAAEGTSEPTTGRGPLGCGSRRSTTTSRPFSTCPTPAARGSGSPSTPTRSPTASKAARPACRNAFRRYGSWPAMTTGWA